MPLQSMTEREEEIAAAILERFRLAMVASVEQHQAEVGGAKIVDLVIHSLTTALATAVHACCGDPEHLAEAVAAVVIAWHDVDAEIADDDPDAAPVRMH
jgi:hypothetical protein